MVVNGIGYNNSAAKFWRGFLAYLYEHCDGFTRAELSAPAASSLRPNMLFPNLELEDEIDRLAGKDLGEAMQDAIAELAMLGPPAPVEVRVMDDEGPLTTYALPAEHADAETFQYLVAWMLAWARIPPSDWNSALIEGSVGTARDPSLARIYGIGLTLQHGEIHEGLLHRVLTLSPHIIAAPG